MVTKSLNKNRRRQEGAGQASSTGSSMATLTASMIRSQPLSVLAMAPSAEAALAAQDSARKDFGTVSAPVSSLLPPIPTNGAAFAQTSTHAQLLALLQQSTARNNFALPPPTSTINFSGLGATEHNIDFLTGQTPSAGNVHNSLLSTSMHNWSLEKLEQHARMLKQLNQSIPPNVEMLLAEARRREDKRQAKRLANRKSASTSRARKKAMVKEMTELNSKLRRQALILALLPDLVIVVDIEGIIVFCSAQAERVLHYKIEDLIGRKLADILVLSSRPKLQSLFEHLLESDKVVPNMVSDSGKAAISCDRDEKGSDGKEEEEAAAAAASAEDSGDGSAQSAPEQEVTNVPDQSFPLAIVKLETTAPIETTENDTSDTSATKNVSSVTNSACITRSPTASSLGNGSDDNDKTEKKAISHGKDIPSSDISNSSSSSADAKKLQKANDNLVRNVQLHNKQMKGNVVRPFMELGYRDDVTGATVTANNASARLSSLQHCPGSSSSEGESGYRESNDSREETSSSASDSSEPNGRRKPLAPTCNVCLIRSDLTTVWCEVTSSIRTRVVEEEQDETMSEDACKTRDAPSSGSAEPMQASYEGSDPNPPKQVTEFLLCLRPIRDGDRKVSQKLRVVVPSTIAQSKHESKAVSDESRVGGPSSSDDPTDSGATSSMSPVTKKRVSSNKQLPRSKRMNTTSNGDIQKDVDNEIVESLMLMSNKKN